MIDDDMTNTVCRGLDYVMQSVMTHDVTPEEMVSIALRWAAMRLVNTKGTVFAALQVNNIVEMILQVGPQIEMTGSGLAN